MPCCGSSPLFSRDKAEPGDFQFDVYLSQSPKDKAVVRPLAERLRADAVQFASQPSTFNFQPTAAPLNQEHRFHPLRLDDASIKGFPRAKSLAFTQSSDIICP